MTYPEKNQTVTLSDGRKLGFATYGPHSKTVVFHFHGSAGSRFERPADDTILQDLGIRLISIDRPGHGLSDFQPDRRLLDWPNNVKQLATHLGVDKFRVMGLSAGGPYALACAFKLSDQVEACAVVSGPAPPDRPSPYQGLSVSHRIITFIFRNIPWLTFKMRRGMYRLASGDVETLRARIIAGFPPADRKVLEPAHNLTVMLEEIREGYCQGWDGPATDDTIIFAPWALPLNDISTRVDIWHGELDRNIPLGQAKYNHKSIPNSRLTVWTELGHLGLHSKWREVLTALTADN
ncbi:MAG: alpha/beta hydrolase [Candidatus Zixiibacteriota bacterium]|nr:MAG: alpha/beta hydrolase [candidate division Zixibacteria bacterium]